MLIFIKGAGDLATGVAHRLHRCGFDVVMTEISQPTTVRCTVAFSQAVYEGTASVEGVTARLAGDVRAVREIIANREAAVVVDPKADILRELRPDAVIDAIIAKTNTGTSLKDAPIVIALGPGFTAGGDCHAVIETKRGHYLGRVIREGCAIENTGIPGNIAGHTADRILRAPRGGIFAPAAHIGDMIGAGDVAATVGGEPVRALVPGVVRGMLPAGTPVYKGMKAGDIDPRGIVEYCYTISDKARAIAGGALEALLSLSCGGRN